MAHRDRGRLYQQWPVAVNQRGSSSAHPADPAGMLALSDTDRPATDVALGGPSYPLDGS
jgi:hypothetical protein